MPVSGQSISVSFGALVGFLSPDMHAGRNCAAVIGARPAGRYWREGAVRQKRLTNREYEVLSLIATDMRNKEIASRLSITEGTVKMHVHNILGKLGVTSRSEAISKSFTKRRA